MLEKDSLLLPKVKFQSRKTFDSSEEWYKLCRCTQRRSTDKFLHKIKRNEVNQGQCYNPLLISFQHIYLSLEKGRKAKEGSSGSQTHVFVAWMRIIWKTECCSELLKAEMLFQWLQTYTISNRSRDIYIVTLTVYFKLFNKRKLSRLWVKPHLLIEKDSEMIQYLQPQSPVCTTYVSLLRFYCRN